MARCPNCARKVHFWHNYSGYCSKQCRTDSITSCPNCGKVGLYKHARLGCCSEECRYWYVAGLLGYDKEALVTPSWDKIVYHVRLPSTSAEISSLQLDELEYDRAIDTVLVVAAPPWMQRSRVLAELPYDRFDNPAWQHLWADGTLTEEELFRFHRLCYEDDLLCQKLGEHVYAKIRQAPAAAYNGLPPTVSLYDTGTLMAGPSMPVLAMPRPMELPDPRITPQTPVSDDFSDAVRAIFEDRGYIVAPGVAENTFILQRNGRTALAYYRHHAGMLDVDVVQRALAAARAAGATQTYVVSNGHFTLQAEDIAATQPVQLIDGDEMAELAARRRTPPAVPEQDATMPLASVETQQIAAQQEEQAPYAEHTEIVTPVDGRGQEPRPQKGNGRSFGKKKKMAPVDAEIVGGEGTA